MTLSTACPGPVELLPEQSPSPTQSQDVLMVIMRPSSGGYCSTDQEIWDLGVTHATHSDMEAPGELEAGTVEDNLVEAQATHYLQDIEDEVMERIEVALPGALDDERRVNKLALVQSGLVGLPLYIKIVKCRVL
jgi:hypothetical protein